MTPSASLLSLDGAAAFSPGTRLPLIAYGPPLIAYAARRQAAARGRASHTTSQMNCCCRAQSHLLHLTITTTTTMPGVTINIEAHGPVVVMSEGATFNKWVVD